MTPDLTPEEWGMLKELATALLMTALASQNYDGRCMVVEELSKSEVDLLKKIVYGRYPKKNKDNK